MSAPSISSVYPADGDSGIPVGESIEILFDRGIDLELAKASVVLYGADYDTRSGPDGVQWTDKSTLESPYFLRSPGFQGLVELDFSLVYWDLGADEEIDPGSITSEADEVLAGVGHKLICTPREALAPDVSYSLHIMGDPDAIGTGVSSRTVFDVQEDAGNVSTTGQVFNWGGYEGDGVDIVYIEITEAGDIGTAKYKWWYNSLGVGSATEGKLTSRRYRNLEDGIQIRFDGSGFVLGDTYYFRVEPTERLATNTRLSFTTNDGTYSEAPESPSTPATSQPPSAVLPSVGASSESNYLDVLSVTPDDRAYNVSINTNQIVITFNEDVDPSTITDETVTLEKISSLGEYQDTFAPVELAKVLTVSGNTLTIDF